MDIKWLIMFSVGATLLSACSRDKDEPRQEPGSLLRSGGDVVNNGGMQ